MVGVSKLLRTCRSLAMLTKLLIFIVSVSSCLAIDNSIDEDYSDEPRDVSQTRLQQQRPFNMENLQRLREKFEHVANLRKASGNSNNNRNTLRTGARIVSSPLAKNEDKNSGQKTQDENQPKFNEMEFYDELQANLPYGIQNVRRDLTSRSTRNQMLLHKPKITFQSLCPSRRTIIPLETVSYEYRPNHYEEVTCFHSYAPSRDYVSDTNKICSEAGFTCIQLNRTVYLTRRVKGTECWESETRIVPSGCECMWPMHTFGDIITYH